MRGVFSYSVICSNSWNWFTLWLKYRANQKHILFPTILLNFFYHFIPIKSIKPLRCKDNRVRKTLLMRKDNRNEQDLRWPALETVSRVSCYLFWYDNFLILCRQSQGFVIWHNLGWDDLKKEIKRVAMSKSLSTSARNNLFSIVSEKLGS